MSESISSSGTRPTWATQTWATQLEPAGHGDLDLGRRAVDLAEQRQRQLVGVDDRVALLLPALARQQLAEVAVPVEQSDADDRDAEVAGGLEVVAGEDAEPAGVLRQHRGDAELGREVADRRGYVGRAPWYQRSPVMYSSRSARASSSRLMKRLSLLSASQPARRRPLPRKRTGSWLLAAQASASTASNRSWVSGCQDHRRLVHQLLEGTQRLGQDGADGEPSDSAHRKTVDEYAARTTNRGLHSTTSRP